MPSLNLQALERQIDARRLGMVHLLVGEDVKLVDRIVHAIEATIDPADQPFALERLYAGDDGGEALDIATSARVLPMLGDRRVVLVLRAERFLKPRRAGKAGGDSGEEDDDADDPAKPAEAGDMAALEAYLAAPVPSTALVFVAAAIDRGRRFTKRLLDVALVTEFGGLGGDAPNARAVAGAAAEWLEAELRRLGRTMDAEASRLVVRRAGGDITKLRGDVERLWIYTDGQTRISIEDVREVVSESTAVEDDWAVVNAITQGDPARALVEVGRRLEHGDSPHALVGQLRWWVSERLADADPARVVPALDALLRTDLALKSSGGDGRVLVERLVVELTGRAIESPTWGPRR